MNQKKRNNKGFSLVELIIVIAIMAVLVAVLAPQYIKYVEKSRESKDATTLDEILRAAQTAAVDPDNTVATGNVTVTIASDGKISITGETDKTDDVAATMTTSLGGNAAMVSTKGKALDETAGDAKTLTIVVNTGTGVTWNANSQSAITTAKLG